MMRFVVVFLCLTMLGCQSASINLSHVKTDRGFLNTGLLGVGDLYLLDTRDDSLSILANLGPEFQRFVVNDNSFDRIRASSIRGITVEGSLSAAVQAQVELEVAGQAFIELNNGRRETITDTHDALSSAINRREARGVDLGTRWFLDAAAEENSPFRLVLVAGAITADSTLVGYRNALSSGATISVPVPGRRGGSVNVEIVGASTEDWQGQNLPVLLDIRIYTVFLNDQRNYDYQADISYRPTERLTDAFRSL
ncbi:MAG: hypothetical protein JJ908_05835 [Rhizobiales bacterium]|nr:hypothetical protein [Hyphomicrobiales bacterium]MBO6697874.1 hypothetical protein [Hyphomicrobiales bacterium]MBO6735872.1 hypothetical protein [Hyphomicrobiales bacterium]MBO6913883.1 hypothetical protein [Hyphomicrobiales bacterium]MBO6955586.1 hypothetical protein [Hyphomicrobiales bacterium]